MTEESAETPLAYGIGIIKGYLKTLPAKPGVYRMLGAKGKVLYVGKAKVLSNRVAAYTQPNRLPIRLQRMVSETRTMEFVVTHTEAEALLLESNLIKKLEPYYNILLTDDKSFPYIAITKHEFPQLMKHRGTRDLKAADYYGPFASGGAVSETLGTLYRVFQLRNCSDNYFEQRQRPCLQYHIKRCTGPCVGKVSPEAYAQQVSQTKAFLSGRSNEIQAELAAHMQAAAEAMEFERAAALRDRIRALTAIQSHQDINAQGIEDADVVAAYQAGGSTCVQIFFFRQGRNYGNRSYFPAHAQGIELPEILAAFLGQFYAATQPPPLVLLSHEPAEMELIIDALNLNAPRKVELSVPRRAEKKRLVDHALDNAKQALERRMAERTTQFKLMQGLADLFNLPKPPERIEVYDNSHNQASFAVGGMIVAGPEGFLKNQYRKFTIKDVGAAGDDFAMMREVFRRRFTRAKDEDANWPDLVLIDGGAGQLSAATAVMNELGITHVPMVGVAKGPDRNAGRERFFRTGHDPFQLPIDDPVLYYIQRLRDEAHRFAIGAHRQKRSNAITASPLDALPGVGPARKKALLHHFGSAKAVTTAGLSDLENVNGISKALAQKIYDFFHGGAQ